MTTHDARHAMERELAVVPSDVGVARVGAAARAVDRFPLTPRETQVLRLMSEGLTTKGIAANLRISFKTAACHRSAVLQKLGVDSTVNAVRWAIRQGMVSA